MRESGFLRLRAGAHGLGHVPLNLKDMNIDVYVSNAHKWLACPKVNKAALSGGAAYIP